MCLTAGQVSDYKGAKKLIDVLPAAQYMLADRGYDADWFSPVLLDGCGVEEAKAMSAEDLLDWLALRVFEIYPTHNTASHTWPWAIKKFGWKAVELLVVALEDPQIKDGSKFIGGMTHKWDYPLQLSPNLKRIKAVRKLEKRAREQDSKFDNLKINSAFHERLSHHLKWGEFLGWFSKITILETADQLTLITDIHYVFKSSLTGTVKSLKITPYIKQGVLFSKAFYE